jgi:hypothetical protein
MLIRGGIYSQGVLWAEFPLPFGFYTMRFHINDRTAKVEKKTMWKGEESPKSAWKAIERKGYVGER